jgi:hypothetical protein
MIFLVFHCTNLGNILFQCQVSHVGDWVAADSAWGHHVLAVATRAVSPRALVDLHGKPLIAFWAV